MCRYLNLLLSFVFQTLWDAWSQTEVIVWSSPVVSVYDVMENNKWFYWINRVPVSWRCITVISYNLYTCFTSDCSRLSIGFITKLDLGKFEILIDLFNRFIYVFLFIVLRLITVDFGKKNYLSSAILLHSIESAIADTCFDGDGWLIFVIKN